MAGLQQLRLAAAPPRLLGRQGLGLGLGLQPAPPGQPDSRAWPPREHVGEGQLPPPLRELVAGAARSSYGCGCSRGGPQLLRDAHLCALFGQLRLLRGLSAAGLDLTEQPLPLQSTFPRLTDVCIRDWPAATRLPALTTPAQPAPTHTTTSPPTPPALRNLPSLGLASTGLGLSLTPQLSPAAPPPPLPASLTASLTRLTLVPHSPYTAAEGGAVHANLLALAQMTNLRELRLDQFRTLAGTSRTLQQAVRHLPRLTHLTLACSPAGFAVHYRMSH
eukprot:XP_001703546.1 predicted protein [Chlamydomonas reinhardtii]